MRELLDAAGVPERDDDDGGGGRVKADSPVRL